MEPLDHTAQKASYRRGTIMGLTAAEAFMLICFILLMLLIVWRVAAEEDLRTAQEFGNNFTEEEKRLALGNKDRLGDIDRMFKDIEAMRPILETPSMTPEKVAQALELVQRFGTLDPDLMSDRMRLVADEDVRRMVEALQEIDEDELLKLTDLVEADKVERVLEAAEMGISPEEWARLQASNEEMTNRLAAYEATGLAPEQLTSLADARNRLDQSGADIAAQLRDHVGSKIEALGGRILDTGDVIFPDRVLFEGGSARIEPAFDTLLREFCRPWFEVLYAERSSLETVQIEGHASSEYGTLSDRPAFDANLDLSQGRAAAVFRRCLDYGGSDEVAKWARATTAAVGYSSSRPVTGADGSEDKPASRRVAFAIDMRSEDEVVAAVLPETTTGNWATPSSETNVGPRVDLAGKFIPGQDYYLAHGYRQIVGTTSHVRDGDTFEVTGRAIRLEGIHVPELSSGLGRQARDFLVTEILGRELTCWLSGDTTFDREVGVCFLEDKDISALMIESGFGQDCLAHSQGRYASVAANPVFNNATLPGYCRP